MSLTPEQLAIRAKILEKRVSASEIAGLLLHPKSREAMHPYESPLRIFAKRTGTYVERDAAHMNWGSRLEPVILAEYAEMKGYTLHATGADARTLTCSRWPYLAATPDGFAEDMRGRRHAAETKNVAGRDVYEWGPESTDSAPNYYRAQLMVGAGIAHELGLSEFDGEIIAQLGGRPPSIFPVECSLETVDVLNEVAGKFVRDHILTGNKPDEWERDAYASEWVKERWRKHDEAMREATTTAAKAARQLTYAQRRIERWSRMEAMTRALLCNEIGEALGIQGLATWKANKNGVRTLRLITKEVG